MRVEKILSIVSGAALTLTLNGCNFGNVASEELSRQEQAPEATSSQTDSFRDATNKAMEAANLTQTAQTSEEWSQVADTWQQAINLMKAVSESSPNYNLAQSKAVEYQSNLEYAQKNFQAVIEANLSDCEKAMRTAAAVSSEADKVEDIDPAIRSCGSMDELIAASSKFPAALDGVDAQTFVSNRCTYNASLKNTSICTSLQPSLTTIHYLAVSPASPTPEDPVPVSDQDTMKRLVAAAQNQDRETYNSIATSSAVSLIPGGAIVDIVSTSGDLVQIKLRSRDIKGNDLSGQTRWTYQQFIQDRQL